MRETILRICGKCNKIRCRCGKYEPAFGGRRAPAASIFKEHMSEQLGCELRTKGMESDALKAVSDEHGMNFDDVGEAGVE